MAELDDPERLAAIGRVYRDSEADPILEALLRRAARIADAPMALVSIVGAHTQMFRAHYGLPPELAIACGTSRSSSFCQLVVRTESLLVINDAALDPRVSRDLVERFGVRAYAGAPIRRGRFVVGSFCVVDVIPRTFADDVLDSLTKFAQTAGTYLEGAEHEHDGVPAHEIGGRSLRERAESLVAAISVVTPIARASRSLEMRDVTPEALALAWEALGQALTFYGFVVREVRVIEALGRQGLMHAEVERIARIVDEIGVMARVAVAFEQGDLDATSAARALSVSRDVFDAADALADAARALIDAIDASARGAS